MTREQYKVWLKDFVVRFPDCGEWIGQHEGISKLWYEECLGKVEQVDAIEANRAIFAGACERWNDFARETIGAHVAKRARQIAYDRVERERKREESQRVTRHRSEYERQRPEVFKEMDHGKGPMGRGLRLCIEWMKEGVPKDERLRRLDAVFGEGKPQRTQRDAERGGDGGEARLF